MSILRQDAQHQRAVEGAGPLFAAAGFDGTTMADIATASGLSLKALYAAFASKADLFDAVLQQHFDRHVAPILALDDPLAVLERTLAAMEDDREYFLLAARGTDSAPYERFVGAFELRLRELVDGRSALPADELAAAMVGSLMALARTAVTAEPPRPITSAIPSMRALFAPHLDQEPT